MSEMVERVAKAIWLCRNTGANDADWADEREVARKGHRNTDVHEALWEARAAVKAMREPTEGMVKAADNAGALDWSPEPGEGLDGVCWNDAWAAMIDTALSEDT